MNLSRMPLRRESVCGNQNHCGQNRRGKPTDIDIFCLPVQGGIDGGQQGAITLERFPYLFGYLLCYLFAFGVMNTVSIVLASLR